MWRGSTESGCPYPGRAVRALSAGRQQSAEAIVAEPNRILMTGHVAGSGAREGNREGLNTEQPKLLSNHNQPWKPNGGLQIIR